jgi:DNA (cytosine-5)-methyltransferase 1
MYIESDHARYRLGAPSKDYRREFRAFFLPHRIVQAIVSSAVREPDLEFNDFLANFSTIEFGNSRLSSQHLFDSVRFFSIVIKFQCNVS